MPGSTATPLRQKTPTQLKAQQAGAAAESASQPRELSELCFEILMAAVRTARNLQVRRLSELKRLLAEEFPKATPSDIDIALKYWAGHLARTGALTN